MSGRILIVEDEAIPALELQLRLESWDYEVTRTEAGGARAIEASRETRPTWSSWTSSSQTTSTGCGPRR